MEMGNPKYFKSKTGRLSRFLVYSPSILDPRSFYNLHMASISGYAPGLSNDEEKFLINELRAPRAGRTGLELAVSRSHAVDLLVRVLVLVLEPRRRTLLVDGGLPSLVRLVLLVFLCEPF